MGMKKLKKAALAHIASSLTNVEFGFLGQLSGGIDQNKYGIIYMEELEKAVKGSFSGTFLDRLWSIRYEL